MRPANIKLISLYEHLTTLLKIEVFGEQLRTDVDWPRIA